MISCDAKEENEKDKRADEMFHSLVYILKNYTDSVKQAPDSASLARLSENFEAEHRGVNMAYSIETDMSLSQGQNDTLTLLTETYVKERNKRMAFLKCPSDTAQNQSLSPDSLSGKSPLKAQ